MTVSKRRPAPTPPTATPTIGVIDAAGTELDQARCRVEEVLEDGSLVVRLMSARGGYRQGGTVRIGYNEFRPD
jgi:hypothetical protein